MCLVVEKTRRLTAPGLTLPLALLACPRANHQRNRKLCIQLSPRASE